MSLHETRATITSEHVNPFGYFISIIRENPKSDKAKHISQFKTLVLGNDFTDYAEAIVDEWCRLKYSAALEAAVPPSRAEIEKRATEQRERTKANREAAAAAVESIKQKIAAMTLGHLMPNGKPLGKCTFGYCAEAGGLFADIARLGKPDQIVGEVITAEHLAAIGKPAKAKRERRTRR